MTEIKHADAWDDAHYKRDHSNSARAYIDAAKTLMKVVEWWRSLPPNLRQDIEGSAATPGAIRRAQTIVAPILEK